MATYTSTQAGDWNNVATWGGGGSPSANNDVVNIGHAVNYNLGVSALTFGNVSVTSGGMLIFPTDSSWKLLFNTTGVLAIASGGEIRTGTSGAAGYMSATYKGQIHWPQGAAARSNFTLADGGAINLYGTDCPESIRYANLDSDWTSGDTLYVAGDYSSKWSAGQFFWIHDNADSYASNGYQIQGDTYEIDSVGAYDAVNDRTPITVTAATPTRSCTAVNTPGRQSKLILISRNLELGDPGVGLGVYDYNSYTQRLRFDNLQATGNTLAHFKNCMFSGWDRGWSGGFNLQGENLCFASNSHGISSGTNHTITGDFVSNNSGINAGTNHTITGDFASNSSGIYRSINTIIVGDFSGNTTLADMAIANTITQVILEDCTFSGADRRSFQSYQNTGVVLSLVSTDATWQAPDSGSTWIYEVTPNSFCGATRVTQIPISPHGWMAAIVPAAESTLTFKIYPVGWADSLTQADVVLEVQYLNTAAGITRATVFNTAQTYAVNGWRSCSVTFTPGQAGVCYFQIYIRKYEASSYLLIDPVWSVS